ncbi:MULTISPECIES: tripartite tricarboxylate transporter substrate binding protein [Comamonas]|jgi:tripartite-type tricarboxylate transporter receptor subunit TctC|uniref:Bug family tripartite tricarboxylate transporter substrate binding protein n=1 Tax=Comamonas TaxID=283 RepID=UPI002845D8FC|nr:MULTISPECIES: tripartite tricarboxylate transporter substrate binding protein [Comamonas]MDR3064076.1 tripartite tricarboxylate transporter substrate binding protein [Comamonas sp.]MEB5966443.1 tripartite tricarboxylate transporter substrate binding protein [Comamonas testosteroni]
MQRRLLCTLAALPAVLGLSALAPAAQAQTPDANWPSKPIRWIVPFPPGGAMDAIARTLGEKAARTLGQPFVIENRPGAGGNIGADFVAKSPADGYTLMITSIGMATNKPLYRKLSYDPIKDFAPVGVLAVVPNILVTNSTQPQIKSVADVVAAAKAAPGKLTYASAGNGTSIHLAGEVFTSLAGVNMLHIPYKGSGPAVSDLLGGQVNYMFDSITSARPHIQSGKLRALAVTTAKRSTSMPDVPTMEEAGIKGYEVSPWFAAFMPAGTPPAIVKKLNQTFVAAMKQPDVIERFQAIGAEVVGSTPEEAARHLQAESQRWTRLINERGIQMD